jgi:hypothetical protein
MEKSVDLVHASWTTASGRSMVDPHGGADGKPPESGRDGALACRCSPTAAGKGKGGMGDSPRGSPELGERWSGRVTRVKWWRQWSSVQGVFQCGRGGERDGEWCGMLRGGGSPFIGTRGGCRPAIMVGIGGETGGGVKGDLSAVMLRFNGG